MLEGLDRIDWSKLTHAYGEASDVPDLIRALASSDGDDRERATYELHGNIWHQGTVYEATAYAVPFLIELLDADGIDGKSDILLLLAYLARGTSYHDVHQDHFSKVNSRTPELLSKISKELIWVQNTKNAVMTGEPTYFKLLHDSNPALRDAAAYVLATFTAPAPMIAEWLWKRIEKETDERVLSSCLLALGHVTAPITSEVSGLLAYFSESRSESVRLAAAISLKRLGDSELPGDVVQVLADACSHTTNYKAIADSYWGNLHDIERLADCSAP